MSTTAGPQQLSSLSSSSSSSSAASSTSLLARQPCRFNRPIPHNSAIMVPSTATAAASQPPCAPLQPNTQSTDPFLRDFTLVAEAAKRAQMAVMMRDFESVALS